MSHFIIVMLSVVMLSGIMLSGIVLSVVMLSGFMLSVITLNVIMMSVIVLNVVMLNVTKPVISCPFNLVYLFLCRKERASLLAGLLPPILLFISKKFSRLSSRNRQFLF